MPECDGDKLDGESGRKRERRGAVRQRAITWGREKEGESNMKNRRGGKDVQPPLSLTVHPSPITSSIRRRLDLGSRLYANPQSHTPLFPLTI